MAKTRTQNSFLNILTGVFGQILTIVLGFATRTVFILMLGKSYLGISGLFQNILQMLSVTDLGLSGAIVFSLYKPLADKDEAKIASIMTLYKRAYRVIGVAVAVLGVCLIPALPYLVGEKARLVNITVVYLLYLFQTVSSYIFFAYRKTIYSADQREHRMNLVKYAVHLLTAILQIVALVLFRSFYVYLIIGVTTTIVDNLIVGWMAGREYPCIRRRRCEKLPKHELSIIKKNVVGSAFYKICAVMTNSTDNILISALVGVDTVGIYSNYLLFTGYIQLFLKTVFDGITASVGNLQVSGDSRRSEFVFRCLNLMNLWLYGFCGIALYCLINPFIQIVWLRDPTYLLGPSTVFLVFFYLVLVGLQYSVKSYRTACGLFWKGKYRPLATVIVNLTVSIVLGKLIGLNGILLGTIVSHLTTLFWYDPWLLYREVFKKPVMGYFARYILRLALVIGVGLGVNELCCLLPETLAFFAVRVLIVLVVPNALFFLIYFRTKEFAYMKDALKRTVFHRLKRRR